MPTFKILTQFRENIVNSVIWLSELEPFYFTMFFLTYAFFGLFLLGVSILVVEGL